MNADLNTKALADSIGPIIEVIRASDGSRTMEDLCRSIQNALSSGRPIKEVAKEIASPLAEIERRDWHGPIASDCVKIHGAIASALDGSLIGKAPIPDATAPARLELDKIARMVSDHAADCLDYPDIMRFKEVERTIAEIQAGIPPVRTIADMQDKLKADQRASETRLAADRTRTELFFKASPGKNGAKPVKPYRACDGLC